MVNRLTDNKQRLTL